MLQGRSGNSQEQDGVNGFNATIRENIVDLLEKDHIKLKELARILRDTTARPKLKLECAREFLKLFSIHSEYELRVLYQSLRNDRKLRALIIEGEVEHSILDKKVATLTKKIQKIRSLDESLREELRVLAEVVTHHLKEEEEELFFYMRKELSQAKLLEMGSDFLCLLPPRSSGKSSFETSHHPPQSFDL